VPDNNGVIEIKDFSFSLEPKRFRINSDVFEACPALPLNMASTLARFKDLTAVDADEKLLEFFDAILLDGSAMRFRERASSKTEPIPMTALMPIINWLLEEYGLRPTVPSVPSSDTSESADGSTPSTDGASLEASTGQDSPSQDS
jgi:hypothetical protein